MNKPMPTELHHTPRNSYGEVVIYYAYPLITNPQQLNINSFYIQSAMQSHGFMIRGVK